VNLLDHQFVSLHFSHKIGRQFVNAHIESSLWCPHGLNVTGIVGVTRSTHIISLARTAARAHSYVRRQSKPVPLICLEHHASHFSYSWLIHIKRSSGSHSHLQYASSDKPPSTARVCLILILNSTLAVEGGLSEEAYCKCEWDPEDRLI
jgi:hypothetical protein